jgi:hypothetical protein
LKCITSPSEQFLSESASVEELIKDASISFLQLDPLELSAQLTLRDYCLFKSIESSEYIDFLFKKQSKYGYSHLTQFSDLSNEEMFWVINEILHESNLIKRARIIKHFIQIAHICKECKNFNSLFAILSGLDHLSVLRLKDTWDKVSAKNKKLLLDLKLLLDPSFNMDKYRQLLRNETIQPPIIPFFPICQKDLYFIKELGETNIQGLVNFEKLRKLAKGVRSIVQMTASSFDLTSMRDVPTSHSIIFSMFGCTNPSLTEFRSGYHNQFTKLNIRADHVKKLYEESVMVRKVRHYLNNMAKNIEKNEERLRLISSTLEHSTSGNTLKRKPSPSSSLGGSLSSINALNSSNNLQNLSNGSSIGLAGISAGNGTLNNNNNHNHKNTIFGAHSPDAVKKLLALSETKNMKTVKSSSSSTSVPLSAHLSNNSHSRAILNNSVHSNSSLQALAAANQSPTTPLSPTKPAKIRSTSNSHAATAKLSNESSSVSTIKLNDSFSSAAMIPSSNYSLNSNSNSNSSNINSYVKIKANGSGGGGAISVAAIVVNNASEADSGRASMASNVDQDQCSPTFQQRAFILNKYDHPTQAQSLVKSKAHQVHYQKTSPQEMLVNSFKETNLNGQHLHKKNANGFLNENKYLVEEEDQVSAV